MGGLGPGGFGLRSGGSSLLGSGTSHRANISSPACLAAGPASATMSPTPLQLQAGGSRPLGTSHCCPPASPTQLLLLAAPSCLPLT